MSKSGRTQRHLQEAIDTLERQASALDSARVLLQTAGEGHRARLPLVAPLYALQVAAGAYLDAIKAGAEKG